MELLLAILGMTGRPSKARAVSESGTDLWETGLAKLVERKLVHIGVTALTLVI